MWTVSNALIKSLLLFKLVQNTSVDCIICMPFMLFVISMAIDHHTWDITVKKHRVAAGKTTASQLQPSQRIFLCHSPSTRNWRGLAWSMPQQHSASCLMNVNNCIQVVINKNRPISLRITKTEKEPLITLVYRILWCTTKIAASCWVYDKALWLVGNRGQDPQLTDGLQCDWLLEFYGQPPGQLGAIEKARLFTW